MHTSDQIRKISKGIVEVGTICSVCDMESSCGELNLGLFSYDVIVDLVKEMKSETIKFNRGKPWSLLFVLKVTKNTV